jgi:hypothetical protein
MRVKATRAMRVDAYLRHRHLAVRATSALPRGRADAAHGDVGSA